MSLPLSAPPVVANVRRYLPGALLLGFGLVIGLGLAWLLRDPHAATAERLKGTVIWSNVESRQIALDKDGEMRDPLGGDTFYYVTGGWEDASGTIHGSSEYPACLVGKSGQSVSMERHRVELDVIHQDYGGQQQDHIAVFVRCFD